MKNIIKTCLIILISFLSFNCQAQNIPHDGDNLTNNNLDKFVGTWQGESGVKTLTIVLRKENIQIPININLHGDVLYGYHELKNKNNAILESSMSHVNDNYSAHNNTLFTMGSSENSNLLDLGIKHISKRKSINSVIEFIDATHIRLVKVENRTGMQVSVPGQGYDPAILIPQDFILTKQ